MASDGQLISSLHQTVTVSKPHFVAASGLTCRVQGLHSTARHVVLGRQSPPVPTGQMAYRVTLPASRLKEALKDVLGLDELATIPRNNHWIGPRGTILSYLLEGIDDTLVNFVFT